MEYKELNHNVSKRNQEGPQMNKVHARVTHNPSSASPSDVLVVKMPQLTSDSVLYPNSLNLTYDFKLNTGEDETNVPDHLTSALVDNFKMTIGGRTILDINRFNHWAVYRDFWQPKYRYDKEMTHRGIQSLATKKKRHAIPNAADDTLATIHGERYSFFLGSFLTDAAFTPQAIQDNVEFHLKFVSGKYTLKNICLEYDYVIDPSIALSIKNKYINWRHIIDDYKSHTTKDVAKEESEFEIDIQASYSSLRAIVIFFKDDFNVSTKYNYPNIKDIKIDIDGSTNQLYSTEYLSPYSWIDAQRYFQTVRTSESYINQQLFYDSKYCLVIDFRTLNDERLSGIGREIKDYIKLKISKKVTSADGKALVYLISDKAISFTENRISEIQQ